MACHYKSLINHPVYALDLFASSFAHLTPSLTHAQCETKIPSFLSPLTWYYPAPLNLLWCNSNLTASWHPLSLHSDPCKKHICCPCLSCSESPHNLLLFSPCFFFILLNSSQYFRISSYKKRPILCISFFLVFSLVPQCPVRLLSLLFPNEHGESLRWEPTPQI